MTSVNWLGSRSNLDLIQDVEETEPDTTEEEKRRIMVNFGGYADINTPPSPLPPSFPTNMIRTSKYTILTFLPKNLFEQFRSVANFYFTSLVVLQAFPPFAEVSTALTAAPVILIIGVTAIKDAFEDWKRHKSDESVNKAKTYLLQSWRNVNHPQSSVISLGTGAAGGSGANADYPEYIGANPDVPASNDTLNNDGKQEAKQPRLSVRQSKAKPPAWKLSKWEDVRVGDFVYLRNNDPIPADIAIISTSEQDCACYVETKNLDGETNLKIRRGITDLSNVRSPEDCVRLRCHFDSEPPNANLYNYNGLLTVHDQEDDTFDDGRKVPLSINGVLLRGCVLRNTKWLIGVVLFTGSETKIMLNSGITPSKRSRIDRQLNPLVMLNFLLLTGMCVICSLITSVYAGKFIGEKAPFIGLGNTPSDFYSPSYAAFVTFFSCMIIFQNIIPIALYISVDISKTVQSFMISLDADMYDAEMDKHVSPQAWNLCDDLGQIEYIFSDKTGTLTCNMMEFRKCSINGVLYGGNFVTEANLGAAAREGKKMDAPTSQNAEDQMRQNMRELFDARYVSDKLSFIDSQLHLDIKEDGEQGRKIREFFTLLAICHTVLAEKKPKEKRPDCIDYKAQSPDEAALVAAARDVGFTFLRRRENVLDVDLLGEERSYTLLNVIEFNSDRKRMSVIGADSVIFERLKITKEKGHQDVGEREQEFEDTTSKHLELFANDGLRTLCLAYKVIPEDQYEAWNAKYQTAQNSIKDRDRKIDAVAELIERDLVLMGATAIEDKLQEGVPETIGTLAKAGIKIWVLTGDKMETAINIGFASNLLKKDMLLIIIRSGCLEATIQQIVEALERFWTPDGMLKQRREHALVIDGESLKFALQPQCRPLLLELGCRCRAVVCCRVSPLQKAKVVSLVRKGLGAMCLAIGDGANDVSMIQEADVGIGIIGKEGLQAVMASDYAIAQFRFLGKLLLVHGRWGYFDCGFSAAIITDFTYGMFFNTFFTVLPTMVQGIFDQDVNDILGLQVPQLYMKGIKQSLFTMERFWVFALDAIYQSLVIYYFSFLTVSGGAADYEGNQTDKDSQGTTIAFSIIITVNLYNGMNTSYWPWMTFLGIACSLIIWVLYFVIYSAAILNPTYGETTVLFMQPHFFITIFVSVALALMPRLVFKFIQQYFKPNDTDIISEYQKYEWKEGDVVDTDIEGGAHTATSTTLGDYGAVSEHSGIEEDDAPTTMKRIHSDYAVNLDAARRTSTASRMKRSNSEHSMANPTDLKSPQPDADDQISPANAGELADGNVVDQSNSTIAQATSTEEGLNVGADHAPVMLSNSAVDNPDGFVPPAVDTRISATLPPRPDMAPEARADAPGSATARKSTVGDEMKLRHRITARGASIDLGAHLNAGSLKTSLSINLPALGHRKTHSSAAASNPALLKARQMFNSEQIKGFAGPGKAGKTGSKTLGAASSSRLGKVSTDSRNATKMSLVFMGTHEELPNLGFCFSHEGGMADVIAPGIHNTRSNVNLMPDNGDKRRMALGFVTIMSMSTASKSPRPTPAYKVRQLTTPADLEAISKGSSSCYAYYALGLNMPTPEAATRHFVDHFSTRGQDPRGSAWGLFLDSKPDELAAFSRHIRFTMNVLGGEAKVGGLASVGVTPLNRKMGLAKEVVRDFLLRCDAAGESLAALHPFRTDFYARLGFGSVGLCYEYAISPSWIPYRREAESSGYSVVEIAAGQTDEVFECFERFAGKTHGCFFKTKEDIEKDLFKGKGYAFTMGVRDAEGTLKGYLVVQYDNKEEPHVVDGTLHFLIYEDKTALTLLLNFLHNQNDQVRHLRIATANPNFHRILLDPRYSPNPSCYIGQRSAHLVSRHGIDLMYKVVNLRRLFADVLTKRRWNGCVAVAGEGFRVRVMLEDSLTPELNKPVVVAFKGGAKGGEMVLEEKDDTEKVGATLEMPVGHFSAMILGAVSIRELEEMGLAKVTPEDEVKRVSACFAIDERPTSYSYF
ncbi:hypothetical protein HK101_002704 [Irineochytrium annulatum]|nr:hypothetical protein HK101_002704 [Irineochytrium annulatum]